MAGLKELRNRLESIKSTQKITSAMKMVAASKLRKAELALDRSCFYSQLLNVNVKRLLAAIAEEEAEKNITYILPELMRDKPNAKDYLLFVFASDRGLCGSYNHNIGKAALTRIKELKDAGKNVRVICYGKKVFNVIKKQFEADVIENNPALDTKDLSFNGAVALAKKIADCYNGGMCDVCEIIYSKFHSALNREIVAEQIYPLSTSALKLSEEDKKLTHIGDAYYYYRPDKIRLLEAMLPKLVVNMVFVSIANSQASEQGARMAAMDNATRSAKDMISSLTLKYNGLRQSAITTELTEIISGAEAL